MRVSPHDSEKKKKQTTKNRATIITKMAIELSACSAAVQELKNWTNLNFN